MDPARQSAHLRKPQRVVEELLRKIRSGEWPVGTRLPSERELATEHGVSRNAIREALAVLQLTGHVQTRLGDGSYIAQPADTADTGEDAGLVAGLNITESLEIREALEIASAYLAIRHASRSDLLKMDAAVAEMEEHLERGDYKAYLHSAADLHVLVAQASHNPDLVKLVGELTERHREDQWLLHDQYTGEIAAYSLDVHRRLAEAIRAKDLVAAAEATAQHYDDYPVLHRSTTEDTPR